MIRINYPRQVINLGVFCLLQVPLLHKFILFDVAFAFFYVGFILLLPHQLNKSLAMVIAFFTGLMIDVFSSTPGIHASACVLIAFMRDHWFKIAIGDSEDDSDINWNTLGLTGSIAYLFPLIMVHHAIIFIVENEGLGRFLSLVNKIALSAVYTFSIIFFINLILAPKERSR